MVAQSYAVGAKINMSPPCIWHQHAEDSSKHGHLFDAKWKLLNLMFYGWIGFPCFLSGSCSPSEHPWHLPTPSPHSICFMWTALDDNFQPSPDKTLSRQRCDLPDSLPCSRRQVVSSLAHSKHAVKNNWINYIYCS